MIIHESLLRIAYIDPGTGGILLQFLIAALVGAGFYFRRGLKKVASLFSKRKTEPKDEGPS
jgi:hypothetical protein